MTQVSKYRISQNVNDQILGIFLQTLAGLTNKTQVSEFLGEFLTPTEKVMLSKRLAIGYLVARGYEYREISRTLKVSTATVGSFARLYKYGTSYKKVVNKILDKIKTKEMFLDFIEGFADMGAVGGAKSTGWFNLRNEIRKKKQNIL